MRKYMLLILSIIALFFWVAWEANAWTAKAEFDLPTNPTDFTEVLVSRTQGNYSQAYGQKSALGESSVLIDGFELGEQYYLVARRLTADGEYSNFSNEIGFIPVLVDSNAEKMVTTWTHSGSSDGFRIYMNEGHGKKMIWEGSDSAQRRSEFACTLYGDQPAEFSCLAYIEDLVSDYSNAFLFTPDRKAENVFQLLPWNARKRLCEAVQPSSKVCFLCHKF